MQTFDSGTMVPTKGNKAGGDDEEDEEPDFGEQSSRESSRVAQPFAWGDDLLRNRTLSFEPG